VTGWPLVRLGDVLKHVPRPVQVDPSGSYREIGIRSHGRGLFHKKPVSGADLGSKKVFWVESGDFVLSIVFAWEGAVGIVGDAETGMIGSHRFPTFQVDRARLDARFLLHYFRTKEGLEWLLRVSPGGAGRNRTLSRTAFLNLKIPLPPLKVQGCLVGTIDSVSDAAQRASGLRGEVEKELNSILLAAYRNVTTDAPRLPLFEVAPLVRREIAVDVGASYRELGVRSFGRGTFHKASLAGADVGTKRIFEIVPGDLVFNIVFAWEGAVAVARSEDAGRVGSHRFLTCVPASDKALAEYLCFHFLTADGLAALGDASPGGAGRNRTLGLKALAAIQVPVPSLDRQRWFTRIYKEVAHARRLQQEATGQQAALVPSVVHRLLGPGLGLSREGDERLAS